MAFFGVTREILESVVPHSNADRLELGKLVGNEFQFVIPKGEYSPGQEVLYFPIDSVLPDSVAQSLGVFGKLSGARKNRLKTVRLRGEISQGLIAKTSLISNELVAPEEITAFLGVEKYEPEEKFSQNGRLNPLPHGLTIYDIESADRNKGIVDSLLDQEVVVMEKLEGSNFSVSINDNGTVINVNSRRNTIIEAEGEVNSWWQAARKSGLIEFVKSLVDGKNPITVYGEFIGPGIQGNIYQLKEHEVRVFDIKIGEVWMSWSSIKIRGLDHAVQFAPVLFEGKLTEYLAGKSAREAAHGFSVLNSKQLREGIVIKPQLEQYVHRFGRLIIKQRCPIYLSKSEN